MFLARYVGVALLAHAATQVALYGRTRHRAVRAEHAAIACEGLEPFATALAVIEELAGIGRHRLDDLMAALRASQGGLKLHISSCLTRSIPRFGAIEAGVNSAEFSNGARTAPWQERLANGSNQSGTLSGTLCFIVRCERIGG